MVVKVGIWIKTACRLLGRGASKNSNKICNNLIYPSLQGATNWASPAYHPQHKLFYVAVREMGSYYYKTEVDYEPGQPFLGGGEQALSGDKAYGAVRALDVHTGERKWEFKLTTPL